MSKPPSFDIGVKAVPLPKASPSVMLLSSACNSIQAEAAIEYLGPRLSWNTPKLRTWSLVLPSEGLKCMNWLQSTLSPNQWVFLQEEMGAEKYWFSGFDFFEGKPGFAKLSPTPEDVSLSFYIEAIEVFPEQWSALLVLWSKVICRIRWKSLQILLSDVCQPSLTGFSKGVFLILVREEWYNHIKAKAAQIEVAVVRELGRPVEVCFFAAK